MYRDCHMCLGLCTSPVTYLRKPALFLCSSLFLYMNVQQMSKLVVLVEIADSLACVCFWCRYGDHLQVTATVLLSLHHMRIVL